MEKLGGSRQSRPFYKTINSMGLNMKKKYALNRFVHRTLIIRLCGFGILLALIIGFMAFFTERSRIAESVEAQAYFYLDLFNSHYSTIFDVPGLTNTKEISDHLDAFAAQKKFPYKSGRFVIIKLYRQDGSIITERSDETAIGIPDLMKSMDEVISKDKISIRSEFIRYDNRPYLFLTGGLHTSNGTAVGMVAAIFELSDKTISEMRWRGLRTMIIVISIVLLSTALLYPVIINLTKRISNFSGKLLEANLETLMTLGNAIALRDSDTNAHNYRVTIYSVKTAEVLGLNLKTIRTLIKGAFLHDVGKIGIPDNILLKPGKLDDEEYSIMKTHVNQGAQIVFRSEWLNDALEVVSGHHEKVNGLGYPEGKWGESIPITARIFAIADVFDALTSERPYKKPFTFEKTMSILEEDAGTHFDPVVLKAFKKIAQTLHEKFSGKEEEAINEVHLIIRHYFLDTMDEIEY